MHKRNLLVLVGVLLSVMALGAAPSQSNGAGLEQAIAAQERHTDALLGIQGVVGTAVGLAADGTPVVLVLTERAGVAGLPTRLDGVPVDVRVTGKIEALHHRPGHEAGDTGGTTKLSPKSRWPRPVPIGISTGNEFSCSAGTIGARVKSGTSVYALSNNHVYALENSAPYGSRVLQPGRYDTSCAVDPNNVIGTLSAFVPIVFSTTADNTVDAAIALSSAANLGNSTPSDGYGTPKSATVEALLNQIVKKYGRTTKLTRGQVVAINATINVGYSSGTARFVDQIGILGSKPFIRSGDSGSLVVTDSGANPVGLAFASSATGYAFANEIGNVLNAFGVTIDDAPSP